MTSATQSYSFVDWQQTTTTGKYFHLGYTTTGSRQYTVANLHILLASYVTNNQERKD